MANRITASIALMERQIADRIAKGETTKEGVKRASNGLDMTAGEFCRFQEAKSMAFAGGILTFDEATTVYALLGSTPTTFNRQPVHVKAVLTKLFAELLGA